MAVGGSLLALLTFVREEFFEAPETQGQAQRDVLLVLVAFSMPAFLYWLIWRRGRPHREVVLVLGLLIGPGRRNHRRSRWFSSPSPTGRSIHQRPRTAPPDAPVVWVWAGPPTSTATSVVARVRDPQATVELAVGTDEGLTDPVIIPAASRAPDDPAVVRFAVDGLAAGTRYFYAVSVDGELVAERSGTLRTAPQGATDLTIALGACIRQRQQWCRSSTRSGLNGPTCSSSPAISPMRTSGPVTGPQSTRCTTTQLTSPAIAALVREVPVAYVWDDHDFGANDADSTAASGPASQIVYRQSTPVPVPAHRAGPRGDLPVVRDGARAIHPHRWPLRAQPRRYPGRREQDDARRRPVAMARRRAASQPHRPNRSSCCPPMSRGTVPRRRAPTTGRDSPPSAPRSPT